ncbi:hypothetical protein JW868_04615 [Candidatus Woesearchaeota archaeon]|nr:hypothetical protein [Candidatus Woesearchaeota archaeon]
MKQKRERLEVIHDILKSIQNAKSGMKPTHIMYKANLSHQMLDEYLKELKEKEFIIEEKNGKGKTYSLTEKGHKYLDEYKLIHSFMESFGLD